MTGSRAVRVASSRSDPLTWLTLSFALFTAGCGMSMSTAASSGPDAHGVERSPIPIVDAHIHTEFDGKPERTSGIPNTRERLLLEMRANNVVGAIAHSGDLDQGYVDLKSAGIIHCAGLGETFDAERLEAGLASGRFRCIKVYLGYVHRFAYDPVWEPAYTLAAKYSVPVVFHTGDTYSTRGKLKYADPLTIDEVAVDHPDVTFVIAHLGNPWIESAAEVAYKNPNVYLDGSALLIGDLKDMPAADVETYLVRPVAWAFGYVEDPSKLMFGTDWPLTDMASYIAAFKRAIPPEHWQAVFHDNAARVFKLE